jgi:signal transduction histidine kinase
MTFILSGIFLGVSVAALSFPAIGQGLPLFNVLFFGVFVFLYRFTPGFLRFEERQRLKRLNRSRNDLRDALERAESSDRTRRSIIANMSHEFRTPLNSVIGFAALLEEGESNPDRAEMARSVQRGGWDLLNLVNGLVKAAELSVSGYTDRVNRFSLNQLISLVEVERGREAQAKGLELATECAGSRAFKGDLEAISSILGILVGNAVKYSERGPITLSAQDLEVSDRGRTVIECRVADHGKGMDKRTVEGLFEPFDQGEAPLIKRYPGVGVGLYTAKRLSEAIRADLRVESELGVGTTAYLVVPLEIDSLQGEQSV